MKEVFNGRYIRLQHQNNKKDFNEESQRGRIWAVSDASYAYMQNHDVVAAAWKMEIKSKLQKWEGSILINAKNNLSYLVYIVKIFIIDR